MHFRVEHHYEGISLEEYESLHFDEPFNIALCEAVSLRRTLVKREVVEGVLSRVVKLFPERTVPAPVVALLGVEKMEYDEVTRYEVGSWRGTWRMEPAMFGDLFVSSGGFEFHALDERRVSRVFYGDLDVRIWGIGGWIEKVIIADIVRSYELAGEFTQRYIADQIGWSGIEA